MTDRYHSIGVVLKKDIRDDDAQCVLDAIKMIKGVLSVKPYVSDFDTNMAEERAKRELSDKLWKVLHPDVAL